MYIFILYPTILLNSFIITIGFFGVWVFCIQTMTSANSFTFSFPTQFFFLPNFPFRTSHTMLNRVARVDILICFWSQVESIYIFIIKYYVSWRFFRDIFYLADKIPFYSYFVVFLSWKTVEILSNVFWDNYVCFVFFILSTLIIGC